MTRRFTQTFLIVTALLFAASSSSALCVNIAGLPPNDVGFSGCAGVAPGVASCDMNGIQADASGEIWGTHGAVAFLDAVWIFHWTHNQSRFTDEYVCRIDPAAAIGVGAVHGFSGVAGVAKSHTAFDCWLTAVCD